jgi:hypothetical protein
MKDLYNENYKTLMNEVEKDVKIFLKIKKTSHVNVFEKLLL